MARLYVLSGPDVGKSFDVVGGARCGRAAECEVHLRDASVSRQHARLERSDEHWSVTDLGSRNGLRVDGRRVERLELADGVEFQIGEVLLRFRTEQAAAPVARAPESKSPAPLEQKLATSAGAQSVPEVEDEIVLEGEWSAPPPAAAASTRAPATGARPDFARPAPEPPTLDRSAMERTATMRAPAAAASSFATTGKSVLQYQRITDRPGAFNADLGQQPAWIKLALALLALLLFAGVFYAVFSGTSLLKERVQSHSNTDEPAPEADEAR